MDSPQQKNMTIENLKKAALSIQKFEERPLHKGLSWFTKLMARFGWHRKYEVIILDSSRFGLDYLFNKKSL